MVLSATTSLRLADNTTATTAPPENPTNSIRWAGLGLILLTTLFTDCMTSIEKRFLVQYSILHFGLESLLYWQGLAI